MFTRIVTIREEQPAWVECARCKGRGKIEQLESVNEGNAQKIIFNVAYDPKTMIAPIYPDGKIPCCDCNGEGGRWHEAVTSWANTPVVNMDINKPIRVTKSSILWRDWEVCNHISASTGKPVSADKCHCCFGSGYRPNTASEWRVL